MPSSTKKLATLRPDLATFEQLDREMNRRGLVAAQLMPPFEVQQQAGNFGVLPIKAILAQATPALSSHITMLNTATSKFLLWEQGEPNGFLSKQQYETKYTLIEQAVDVVDELTDQLIEQERFIDHLYLGGVKSYLLKAFAGVSIQDDIPSWDCFLSTRDAIEVNGTLWTKENTMLEKYSNAQTKYTTCVASVNMYVLMDQLGENTYNQGQLVRAEIEEFVAAVNEFETATKACSSFPSWFTDILAAAEAYQADVDFNGSYIQLLLGLGYEWCE